MPRSPGPRNLNGSAPPIESLGAKQSIDHMQSSTLISLKQKVHQREPADLSYARGMAIVPRDSVFRARLSEEHREQIEGELMKIEIALSSLDDAAKTPVGAQTRKPPLG